MKNAMRSNVAVTVALVLLLAAAASRDKDSGPVMERINRAADKVLKATPIFAAIHLAPFQAHEFEAILIRCSDGRYGDNTRQSVRQALKTTSFDDISVPGGVLALVDPLHSEDKDFVLRQIDLLKNAHHNKVVIFQGHTRGCEGGCAAMAAKYSELKDAGPEVEMRKHVEVQYKAEQLLKEKYPDLKIVMSVIKPEMEGKKEMDKVFQIP